MPGPMSTPLYWTNDDRKNQSQHHGTPATETSTRRSGKTAWTHASGQWEKTRQNKAERSRRGR